MYFKSLYPDPPVLPEVNVHHLFFKRPEQAEWPDYVVHVDVETEERIMYRDFTARIQDLATGLGAPLHQGGMGLRAEDGEIVGIMGENSSEYITLIHSCLFIATPFALISSYSTPFELKHALSLSKVTRLFVDEKRLTAVLPVAKSTGMDLNEIYLLKGKAKGRRSLQSIIHDVRKQKLPPVDIQPAVKDTLAYLIFSSGTSGLPKAVMISHGNIIYSIAQAIVLSGVTSEVYMPPVPAKPEGISVILAFLPLHHAYGLQMYAFRSLLVPATLALISKWDINVALRAIPKYKVSFLALIPSIIHQLVNHPDIEKVDFSSVNSLGSGAAYLPAELGAKLASLVPQEATFNEGYGMSEGTMSAVLQPHPGTLGGKLRCIPGSVGVLLPGMEARIVRDDGTEADVNEPGELWLRGNSIALGYWNNPKANLETFVDGWLRTGDQFRVDEEGYFWFADRTKDTLKISGAQVSPVEIENCLLDHPEKLINDVTVAGVSGGRTSDEKIPRAWIVLSFSGKKRGASVVIKELESWHQKNLSKYKWLRGGIEVVEEIPKSPTGKVLRRVLQDRYELNAKKKLKGKL